MGTWKAMLLSFLPIQLRDDLVCSLGRASRSRDGQPLTITPQLLRGAIQDLLVPVMAWTVILSLSRMPKLSWVTLARGAKQRDIADNLQGVVILLMVCAHHKHGSISRRNRDDVPFGPALQVRALALSMVVKTSVDSTAYSAPASLHLMLTGSHSWKIKMGFPLMTNFPFSALTVLLNLP